MNLKELIESYFKRVNAARGPDTATRRYGGIRPADQRAQDDPTWLD